MICFLGNISLSAEGISVKLRGKLALVGILSGIAYLTHTLVKHDTQTRQILQAQLGPPKRTIQIERGFNRWIVNYYRRDTYYFLNNRFIRKKTTNASFLNQLSPNFTEQGLLTYSNLQCDVPFPLHAFTYTSASVNPRWWPLCLWHPPITLPPVTPYLHLLEAGRLHFPDH